MKGIVDRIEGAIYVIELEDGQSLEVIETEVCHEVKEGDVVELQDGVWVSNPIETKNRAERIKTLMDEIWADD